MGKRIELRGISVNSGVVIAPIYVFEPFCPSEYKLQATDFCAELARYQEAKEKAVIELNEVICSLGKGDAEKAAIFEAHKDILEDEEIVEQICDKIKNSNYSAENAVMTVYRSFADIFAQIDDPVIRERKSDMDDVSLRLLRVLEGKRIKTLSSLEKPCIVAAHDLLPSDTATLDRKNILGILTESGNITSHTAIIAKNYGIPTILGIKELLDRVEDDEIVIMDAEKGQMLLHPEEADINHFEKMIELQEVQRQQEREYLKRELYSKDGTRILINANIGAPTAEMQEDAKMVDGVGLFRTEFLYMENTHLPTEEEQFEAYRSVLEAYAGKPVILRTIDIGGDKTIPYFPLPKEDNPCVIILGLILCYEHQDMFCTQLRAALRASVYGKLEIMFPMVGSMDDLLWAKTMVSKVCEELDQEKIARDPNVKIGIMMEIPSVMMIADQIVHEVDFASVGTNDLCQYLTASDRMNTGTSRYYQNFHPAMFRLIGYAAKQFAAQGKQLSICGEMGGNPLAAPVLVGLGVRKLSMSRTSVGKIKQILSNLTLDEMEHLSEKVQICATDAQVQETIRKALANREE